MAPKKRSFGSLDTLPSGKIRARYTGPDGILHKADRTFHSEDDATSWLRREEKLIVFNEWTPPADRTTSREERARTTGEWITEWLDLRSRGTHPLAASTIQDYENTLNRRILEVTGPPAKLRSIPLVALARKDVSAWWDAINKQFDSAPYNRNAYARLRTAMQAAVDRDLIPANPVSVPEARRRPASHRKELPEADVMNAIVNNLDHTKLRVDGAHKLIAILTLFHGLRLGEVLALKPTDFTITKTSITVRIRRTAYRVPGKGMEIKDTPKTDSGWREVPIFTRFHNDVRWHMKNRAQHTYMFTGATGKIVMDTSYRSVLKRAKERAGYGDVRLTSHYGRVWLITALAELSMTPPAIGEILGQRDLRTITEIYMRSTKTVRDQILGKLNSSLPKG